MNANGRLKVAVLGASGYTGAELLRLVVEHNGIEIAALTADRRAGEQVGAVYPHLAHLALPDMVAIDGVDWSAIDAVFCCLPHGTTQEVIAGLPGHVKIVDLSADFRLTDTATYARWYGGEHRAPGLQTEAVYGLTEIKREVVRNARLVANPGCYTSTSILGLAPLLSGGFIEPKGIIIDAKSGISGAGRAPKLTALYSECNENVTAYAVGRHRHTPEIDLILSQSSELDVEVVFTPHLMPMDRGILCTMYARPTTDVSEDDLLDAMRSFYEGKPFVRIVEHLPSTKDVTHTNFCDITVRKSRGQVIIMSCTDNLIKGAAGVAVQNFNLMCGFEETTGLLL